MSVVLAILLVVAVCGCARGLRRERADWRIEIDDRRRAWLDSEAARSQ